MQRYFIYLSYDGAAYHGWQIQPNGITVQQKIEHALSTILREPATIIGAGRTDTGVNARFMVAHTDIEAEAIVNLADKMNSLLPPDIAIHRIAAVRAEAHSRFDATSRTYRYYLIGRKDPFLERYAMRYRGEIDVQQMNEAAQKLFLYSDFTSFSKLHTDVKTNNCRIMQAQWQYDGEGRLFFLIQADRFLRNMVRAIVGTLLDVGRGKLTIDQFCRIIEQKDRCKAGSSVPAQGLFLWDISYPDNLFI